MKTDVSGMATATTDDSPGADWRTPKATLGEMANAGEVISPQTPVSYVERQFLNKSALNSIVLDLDAEPVCISRTWFFATLSGPLGFGRSMYMHETMASFPQPETLVLDAELSPLQASREVVKRPAEHRYDDIVVRFGDGHFATLPVAELISEVAYTHRFASLHDQLTGLANRVLFLERITAALKRHPQTGGVFAVLFIDLDNFKPINDVLGHDAGDIALLTVAKRLQRTPGSPTVARFGGDEFGMLLDNALSTDEVMEVVEWVISTLSAPMLIYGEPHSVSACVGVAFDNQQSSTDDLLRHSDIAMYEAKRMRKGSYGVYDSTMRTHASKRLEFRSDLENALGRAEFKLVYQPIVDVVTRQPIGAEALVRWQRRNGETVPPNQFIPLAEQTGMIVPLGNWVLDEACAGIARLPEPDHNLQMLAINVSSLQLREPELVEQVVDALNNAQLTPDLLTLEITESLFIDDNQLPKVIDNLQVLRGMGVKIALDDFGSGFSGLRYLARLPVDSVKLDRGFINTSITQRQQGLVSGIVSLAHSLGLTVAAEGIETEEQLVEVSQSGCEFAQGYLFARPLPLKRCLDMLARATSGIGAGSVGAGSLDAGGFDALNAA